MTEEVVTEMEKRYGVLFVDMGHQMLCLLFQLDAKLTVFDALKSVVK